MQLNMRFIGVKSTLSKWNKSNPKINYLVSRMLSLRHSGTLIFRLVTYLLLFDLAFIFLYPFFYMIVTALKSPVDMMDITVNWIPRSLHTNNFTRALQSLDYFRGLLKTSFVTIFATIGHIISCSMVAYGFARYKFPLRDILFVLVLLTIIIPTQTLIISLIILYSKIGWLNNYMSLIVPTFFGFGLRGGLFIFIFRQFFLGMPHELEEAARIDGCNAFRTYWTIVLPVAKSALLVCTILSIVWHWNDFFEPAMYITKPALQLLPSKLPSLYEFLKRSLQQDSIVSDTFTLEGVVMAATFLVILPILIVYLFLQKKFMEGIERSGLIG